MKRTLTIIIALLLAFGMALGCAPKQETEVTPTDAPITTEAPATEAPAEPTEVPATEAPTTRMFTDSVGREVELPAALDKIAISGPLAQIVLFSLAPDKLVGIANAWDETAKNYFDEKYYNLPELGQLYGGKGEMNLEVLLNSGAQVVIDVGEPKDSVKEDLDALTEQTGIPFVHITMTTDTAADAYRMLGDLLGMEEEAEVLATYCDTVLARTKEIAASVEKTKLVYCLGDAGLNVIAKGSFHGEVIELLSDNVAVVEDVSSKGSGNEVTMEQLLLWDPEVIIFAPDSIYGTVGADPTWQELSAIKNGKFYAVPFGPYNWMGFPPSVQRYMGMIWLSQLLYPETAQYDIFAEVANYYRLFYHCEITDDQIGQLMLDSLGKR